MSGPGIARGGRTTCVAMALGPVGHYNRVAANSMKRILIFILVLVLVGGTFYWLSQRRAPAPAATISEVFQDIPGDAIAIVSVDLKDLRNSPFWQKTSTMFPETERDPEFKQFVSETGFDYERDLDRFIVATRLLPGNQPQSVAIADGHFDRAKVRAYAQRRGRTELRDGTETYIFDTERKTAIQFHFLSDSRIMLTEIARAASALSSTKAMGSAMREKLASVSGATIFAVVQVEALPKTDNRSEQDPFQPLRDLRGTLDWLTLAAQPEGERLRVQLQGQAASTFKAMQAGVLLDGLKMLATSALRNPNTKTDLTEEEQEALLDLLEKTQITREGNLLQARLEITSQFVKRFVEKGKRDSGRKGLVSR